MQNKSIAISKALAENWEMLTGSGLQFSFHEPKIKPNKASRHFMVPFPRRSRQEGPSIALEISEKFAQLLAAAMFEKPEHDLTHEDLQDACSELCNIFSASVAAAFPSSVKQNMGTPLAVDFEKFKSTLASHRLAGYFDAKEHMDAMSVYLLFPA